LDLRWSHLASSFHFLSNVPTYRDILYLHPNIILCDIYIVFINPLVYIAIIRDR
jgi:hypothetical protein